MSGVKCGTCERTVYPHEPNLNLDGRVFHKKCAKCKDCGKYLSLLDFGKSTDFIKESFLLCKRHYEERFLRSGGNFKGGWQPSEKEGIQLMIQKRKSVNMEEATAEDEAAPPTKKSPPPDELPVPNLTEEKPEATEDTLIDDGNELSVIESTEDTLDAANASVDVVAPLNEESTIVETDCSLSPLNMTSQTVNSTEKTYFLEESNDFETAGAEDEAAVNNFVAIPATSKTSDSESIAIDLENKLNNVESTPLKYPPSSVQDVEDEVNLVRSRIKALNRTNSKFVPTPMSLKKADAIDVQFFGPNRVTSNKKLGLLFQDEPN